MSAITTTAVDAYGPIRPTDNESCAMAERVLDDDCTVYADRGEIIAVAFTAEACDALEREETDVSLDYAFDLIGEAEESLDLESVAGARTALKLLRSELKSVQAEMRGDQS